MSKHLVLMCTAEVNGVPDKIKILPFGNIKSQKGDFIVDDESYKQIKNNFKNRGLDLVIDYEHQTLENVQAPAGGWIKDIEKEDDAIVAKVEWTSKAAEFLKNKEYRYLSPVVLVRKSDNKAIILHSVALTNTPAINNMYPIINSIDLNKYYEEEMQMDLKKLAITLGLPETATEDEVMEVLKKVIDPKGNEDNKQTNEETKKDMSKETKADEEIVANKTICGLLGVTEDAKTEDVAAAIMALKNPSDSVTVAEYKALKARLDKKDSEELVLTALKSGKISSAQKDWAEEYALKDPSGFKKFVEKAPQTVPMGELDIDNNSKGTLISDETTMKVCKMVGVNKEDVDKYLKKEGV